MNYCDEEPSDCCRAWSPDRGIWCRVFEVWQESYRPFASAALPRARRWSCEIPWERMELSARAGTAAGLVGCALGGWDRDQRRAANEKLLKAASDQRRPRAGAPDRREPFRTTDRVRPWDGEPSLRPQAGCTTRSGPTGTGKAETIVRQTVWSDTTDYISYEDAGGNNRRATPARSKSSEVPVVVEQDETGFTAFFLRVDR